MGKIKKDIRDLSKDAGSKQKAVANAESWFLKSKSDSKNKEVSATSDKFMPGKIYVFEYRMPKGIETLEWWDSAPVVLALDQSPTGNDCGINLNILPVLVKEELLDFVYEKMQGQIKSNSAGKRAMNAKRQGLLKLTYKGASLFLKQYGYDFAIRQYITKLKSRQAVVSYENWAKIVLCDFANLKGINPNTLKEQFRKHLKK